MSVSFAATDSPARRGALRGLPWVTWRQHRFALGGALLVLGGIGAFLVIDGLAVHQAFHRYGLTTCGDLFSGACHVQLGLFQQRYQGAAETLPAFLMLLPGLLGLFVGAPLVARELDSGTYRFAWTQGRSRVRWIVAKLAILAPVLTVLAIGFSLLFTWWYGPWLSIMGRMNPGHAYEVSGIVFAARTLFAFMLGALAGTFIRRTVPAMAATAVVWLAVVLFSMFALRPLIESPVTHLAATDGARTAAAIELSNGTASVGADGPVTAWDIARWTQDASGHHLTPPQITDLLKQANFDPGLPVGGTSRAAPAPTAGDPGAALLTWLAQHGYRLGASYQPASRFWHFQGVEATSYLLLSLLCAAVTVRWIRRRTA